MINLLGFKNYDGEPHEWIATQEDAMKVAQLMGMNARRNAVAFVTIYPRGVDSGEATGYINGADGAIPDTSEIGTNHQRNLFSQDGR